MLGFNRKNKKVSEEDRTYLAIDIGTENIKTVVFRKNKSRIEILGFSNVPQDPFSMSKAIIIDSDSVLDVLDRGVGLAINDAENRFENLSFPGSAVVGIAGELVSGAPIVVNLEREDSSEVITESEIEEVVEKVKEHSFESIKDEIAEENGIQASVLEEIETVVESISIDNTRIINPVGLTAENISYRVFSSFAPRVQIDSIRNIANNLKLDLEKIAVEPYMIARSIDDKEVVDGGIFIDIGSGTTDISVLSNGDIQGIKIFAIGGRVFTKRIQELFDVDYQEAEEMKIKYSLGSLDTYQKKEIKKGIKIDIESWALGVELALEEFDDVETFPEKIYICGGGALLPDIMEALMEYPWIQRLNFKKHPKVSFIFPNKLRDIDDLTREMNEPNYVTPLSLTRSIL